MSVSVPDACARFEARGLLEGRKRDDSARIVPYVEALLGGRMPADLKAFYRESIYAVGEFRAVSPVWNDRVGWRTPASQVTELLHAQTVPIMGDGCGNLCALDLTRGDKTPAVYFFDHEYVFDQPLYAAGSSLGAFLLLMGDHDRTFHEGWPMRWELSIDPDIDKCPRAPPIWLAG